MKEQNHPNVIKIRNAHVHNLKHINVDIPLNKLVGIAGVSGSGNPKYIWNRIGTVKHIMTMFSRLANHSSKLYNSKESSASTHICKFSSRYNLAYSNGSSIASDVKEQSDPGVVFKFFSASKQSMRSI